jgi:hypothetical protein
MIHAGEQPWNYQDLPRERWHANMIPRILASKITDLRTWNITEHKNDLTWQLASPNTPPEF